MNLFPLNLNPANIDAKLADFGAHVNAERANPGFQNKLIGLIQGMQQEERDYPYDARLDRIWDTIFWLGEMEEF